MVTRLYPHIVADTDILAGQPVIEGTAVPVSSLVAQAATGKPLVEIAREAGVTMEDVRAALNYAAQRASEPVGAPGAAPLTGAESQATDREARQLGLAPEQLTPLVRRLLALRAQSAAEGEPPLTSWEEVAGEVAERRGGDYGEREGAEQ